MHFLILLALFALYPPLILTKGAVTHVRGSKLGASIDGYPCYGLIILKPMMANGGNDPSTFPHPTQWLISRHGQTPGGATIGTPKLSPPGPHNQALSTLSMRLLLISLASSDAIFSPLCPSRPQHLHTHMQIPRCASVANVQRFTKYPLQQQREQRDDSEVR